MAGGSRWWPTACLYGRARRSRLTHVDTTLVCPVRDGQARPGLALEQAAQRKMRTYPELQLGGRGRCRLVVRLGAASAAGRWRSFAVPRGSAAARGPPGRKLPRRGQRRGGGRPLQRSLPCGPTRSPCWSCRSARGTPVMAQGSLWGICAAVMDRELSRAGEKRCEEKNNCCCCHRRCCLGEPGIAASGCHYFQLSQHQPQWPAGLGILQLTVEAKAEVLVQLGTKQTFGELMIIGRRTPVVEVQRQRVIPERPRVPRPEHVRCRTIVKVANGHSLHQNGNQGCVWVSQKLNVRTRCSASSVNGWCSRLRELPAAMWTKPAADMINFMLLEKWLPHTDSTMRNQT